jgi:FMN phosphatase YigB (HAD superfamily)
LLIIFDLDDTLIDTTGSITPPLIKKVLRRMGEAGLSLLHFEEECQAFLKLYVQHLTGREALKDFLRRKKAPPHFYEIGVQEMYDNPVFDHPIRPLNRACEILEELKSSQHCLALVTIGDETVQKEKMQKGGIQEKFFSRLLFCRGSKKEAYSMVAEEMGIVPEQVLVCGDRISIDLAPAKELGFKTVHVKWGRGLGNTGLKRDVDYTISHLSELKKIIEGLE